MNPREALLAKAERFLRSAELLIRDGDLDSAVSRVYYSIFHVATALLDTLGQSFSSHRAVISAFGREFTKTGRMDPRFGRFLTICFQQRQKADYDEEVGSFDREEVAQLVLEAREFLGAARQWLQARGQR